MSTSARLADARAISREGGFVTCFHTRSLDTGSGDLSRTTLSVVRFVKFYWVDFLTVTGVVRHRTSIDFASFDEGARIHRDI